MLILKYETYPDHRVRQGYFKALQAFVEPIRVEEGCLDYQVYEWPVDSDTGSTVTLFQFWHSEQLLKCHMAGPRFNQFLQVLELLSIPRRWNSSASPPWKNSKALRTF